jgi:hypothetical protein
MNDFTDILLILFGWLLGALCPGIIEAIRKRKTRSALFAAFSAELHDLRFSLAILHEATRSRLQTMDQGTLDFVRPILLDYQGDDDDRKMIAGLKQLFEQGDATYIALSNRPRDPGVTMLPIPYETPFLNAHVADLGQFPVPTQRALFRVLGELHMFNQQVADVRDAHAKTFVTTGANYTINQGNLRTAQEKLAVRAKEVVKAVNALIDTHGRLLLTGRWRAYLFC